MKMPKKLVLIGTVLASSVGVVTDGHADCRQNRCDNVMIEKLFVRGDDAIQVSTTGIEASLECTPSEEIFLTLRRTHPNQKEIYAALLSAKLADHNIRIRLREETEDCTISYVMLE
jgi:hypothetical protein